MITLNKKVLLCVTAVIVIGLTVFYYLSQTDESVSGEVRGTPYYQGDKGENTVAFVMNVDWGNEYIPDILALLKKEDIEITFFLTGRWCQENQDLAKSIYQSGMEIGNHGLKHKSPSAMTYEENKADIEAAEAIFNEVLGVKTMLFAPAAGEIEGQVLNAAADLGYKTILWSVDTIDWQKPAVATIIDRVLSQAEDGDIVLMHPTDNTLEALPSIIKGLKDKDLDIVPVSQLID